MAETTVTEPGLMPDGPLANPEPEPDAKDTKPKRSRKSSGTRPASPRPTSGRGPGRPAASMEEQLTALLGTAGVAVSMLHEADGATILKHAENVAQALDKLQQENPQVRRVIKAALATSAWGGVSMAVFPMVVELAQNHNAIPEGGMFGRRKLATVTDLPAATDAAAEWAAQVVDERPQVADPMNPDDWHAHLARTAAAGYDPSADTSANGASDESVPSPSL